jgi:hypothetical protein
MFTTLLTIAAMFAFVLAPALIPAVIHAVHGVRNWEPNFALPAFRFAVPAAA